MDIKHHNNPSQPRDYVTDADTITPLPPTYNIYKITEVLLIAIDLNEYIGNIIRPTNLTNGNGSYEFTGKS